MTGGISSMTVGSIELRSYQLDLIAEIQGRLARPGASVMCQLPTGAGKTVVACHLLADAVSADKCGAWLTHRRELGRQSGGMLSRVGLDVSWLAEMPAAERRWSHGAVTMVSPALRTVPEPESPGLLVVDEAHHVPAATWRKVVEDWRAAGGQVVGMTATPWRMSRTQSFLPWFDELVCGPSIQALQDQGWLSRPVVVVPGDARADTRHARIASTGDYQAAWAESEIMSLLAHAPVLEVWESWTSGMPDRRTMWFAPTVHCANALAARLAVTAGAAVLTGETPARERDAIIADIAEERLTHLVSVDVLSEGLDLPDVPTVASLRPTRSLAVWLQQCGRGARPKPSGEYLVLDYAGNCQRHGLPDAERWWSLTARGKPVGSGEMPSASCWRSDCRDVRLHPSEQACWHCGTDQYMECSACRVHKRWTNYRNGTICIGCKEALNRYRQEQKVTSVPTVADLARKNKQYIYRKRQALSA